MSDDLKIIPSDEGEVSAENELKELQAIQKELAQSADGLSQQALESAASRIEGLKKDNPGLS